MFKKRNKSDLVAKSKTYNVDLINIENIPDERSKLDAVTRFVYFSRNKSESYSGE